MDPLPVDVMQRDAVFNKLTKEFMQVDLENKEFSFCLLAALINVLIKKGYITEGEYEEAVAEASQVLKLIKHRKTMMDRAENPESGV